MFKFGDVMSQATYQLIGSKPVTITPDNGLTLDDIERVIMTFFGFTEGESTLAGTGVWLENGNVAYVSVHDKSIVSSEMLRSYAESLEATPLDLINDPSFAQETMRRLHITVTALPFIEGSLVGLWKAERLSVYRPFDTARNGVIVNQQQPLDNTSTSITQAIFTLACRILGIGKRAYITFPNGAEGEAAEFYTDPSMIQQFASAIGSSFFPAPALDQYALVDTPQQALDAAVEVARAQCRAALTPDCSEKTSEPEDN
jgi:hypothetical protein